MPYNNSLSYRDLWHWCRVWQWEQYEYDIPLPTTLNQAEKDELCTVEQRLTTALDIQKAPREAVSKAYNVFQKARIQRSGTGFIGAPILTPDELDRSKGEISWKSAYGMTWKRCYPDSLTILITIIPKLPARITSPSGTSP